METLAIIVIIIVLVYVTKNEKGKKVVDHFGNAAVHIAASADKASAALERQCDELLSDKEAEALKAEVQASMAEEVKATKAKLAKKTEDIADYSDIL